MTGYEPTDGSLRYRVVFALLPRRCSDGRWRWMQKIFKVQRYECGWETLRYESLESQEELR